MIANIRHKIINTIGFIKNLHYCHVNHELTDIDDAVLLLPNQL